MEGLNWKTALTRQLTLTPLLLPHHLSRRWLHQQSVGKSCWSTTEAPLKRALIPFGGIKMIEGPAKRTTANWTR